MIRTRTTLLLATSALGITPWFASTPAGRKAVASTDDSGTNAGYGY